MMCTPPASDDLEFSALRFDSFADFMAYVLYYGNGRVLGNISAISISKRHHNCEIGYCYGSKYWNQGYATEACGEILRYAFEELGMDTVKADAALKNTRSQHVLEKVGFRYTHEDETFKYYRCDRL